MYQMGYMASIYGVSGMEGYIAGWDNQDPNYRRALDDTSSNQLAPMKEQFRCFLWLTKRSHYARRLSKIVDKFGPRPPFIMHLLAHTDFQWPCNAIGEVIELYNKEGITIDKDLKYSLFRAKELRVLVEKKHRTLSAAVREAEEKSKRRATPINLDPSILNEVDKVAEDECEYYYA